MESSENKAVVGTNQDLDWPIILFIIVAYAIAWSALAVLGLVADLSGMDS
jgi:hypothetical protein